MNDRYKELACEAAEWCKQYAEGTPVAWEWEQKFAELIIQECTEQVGSLMGQAFHESVEMEALLASRLAIKKHFGIS